MSVPRNEADRSRTQAMYKATSISGRDRPSSWAPFLVGSTSAGSTLATWRSKDAPNNNMEMLYVSSHTSCLLR